MIESPMVLTRRSAGPRSGRDRERWRIGTRLVMADPGADDARSLGRSERRDIFERTVDRLMDRLYGTALRLAGDPDDAEDIVAETVAKAWASFGDLRDAGSLEGWLFRILNNTFVSAWRRHRTRSQVEQHTDPEITDPSAVADFSLFEKLHQPFLLWWGTPEERFLNDLLREDLQAALDNLPDAFRIVVVLVEVQGHTYEEVADLLEIPVGTVRSRLSRGRSLLQRRLWEIAREEGLDPGATGHGKTR
ncbi:RNA polymerase sigma-54 factor RpoN [Thioalkalivibrio nitratireducens DSM 14787]|uniref:RNA polymerase sigma-54 factor RpoN n=2 Tax=Thioalkalivibrio nitratireducens TaxID=186931 RepID=L0DU40_THIND|nr:RNA polymerase sigma-54 factor RpoN [Thioalkalivibrio nitratireducens DSM 14787]